VASARLAACFLTAGLVLPRAAAAQLRVGGDALLATRYVWRGVERTNGLVLQPDAYVAVDLRGKGWVTGGAWANLELERSGRADFSDRADGKRGLGERDAWLQLTRDLGGVDCTAGWAGYFRRVSLTAGRAVRYDTHEIYATVQARSAYLSPRLSAWYDVSRIRGLYVESSIDVPVMGAFRGQQFWGIYLTAAAGLNVGQGPDTRRPLDPVNFAEKGVTHLDLGAAVNIRGLWTEQRAALLEAHLQFNRDPYTKRHSRTAGDDDHLVTAWAGVSVGVPAYHATGER
jgi:hypothetical protein